MRCRYLAHEIALLAALSANASRPNPLKAIFTYELFDEPHQGREHAPFCAMFIRNATICQDRLGQNRKQCGRQSRVPAGNSYPETCTTGNTSVNGESCYGLLSTVWSPGPACDQYPSCNFTAGARKPAFAVVKEWAKKLARAG
jgi:hypothetical protein